MESCKDTATPVCGLVPQRATSDRIVLALLRKYDVLLFILAHGADVDEYGVLLFQVSADREADTFSKLVNMAAKVLTWWAQVGLHTWQAAKEDGEPLEIQQ